jgi:hypothetical protein
MKMETVNQTVKQVYIEDGENIITVTQWSNLEGCTVCMTQDLNVRFAAELRWEEMDLVIAALSAARAS